MEFNPRSYCSPLPMRPAQRRVLSDMTNTAFQQPTFQPCFEYGNEDTLMDVDQLDEPKSLIVSAEWNRCKTVEREGCVQGLHTPEPYTWNKMRGRMSTSPEEKFGVVGLRQELFQGRALDSIGPKDEQVSFVPIVHPLQFDDEETLGCNEDTLQQQEVQHIEHPAPKQSRSAMQGFVSMNYSSAQTLEETIRDEVFADEDTIQAIPAPTSDFLPQEYANVAAEIRRRAELETEERCNAIKAQSHRLGFMKRALNAPGSKRRYRYKFQDGAEYRRVMRQQQSLRQRIMELDRDLQIIEQKRAYDRFNLKYLAQANETQEELQHVERIHDRLSSELAFLRKERSAHIHASHLVLLQEESPFASRPVLCQRYVLTQLLGRGGFCEVWKAFDMRVQQVVAIKFHKSYQQARTEYDMQSKAKHPNIVQVHGELIIGSGAFQGYFAIVMELVESNLATQLKLNRRLSEVDARNVIAQIMDALCYLNSSADPSQRLVHYDLKPENILLTESGRVKIADFGLSKYTRPSDSAEGIAGTYWYLPPEIFTTRPYDINSKIDVWSVGVIFYQLLYGSRPFGDGMTQQELQQHQVILNATQVTFPDDIPVSDESKEFIKQCFMYNQVDRPDIRTLCGIA